MWHYARGVGFAAQGDSAQAEREAAHIAEITQKADFSFLLAWTVPAPDLLRLARHVVEGRIALAQGDPTRAVKEFQVAACAGFGVFFGILFARCLGEFLRSVWVLCG